jgi:hypothetical protein
MSTLLTLDQLKQMVKNPHIDHWYAALSQLLDDYEINTPRRIAAFIAQCAHESGNFVFIKENLNYKAASLRKVFPKYFPTDLTRLQPDWDSALGGAIVRRIIERDADLDTEIKRKRTVSVHMRMGDYLILPHHQVDLGRYLMNALQNIPADSRIHLFSDEPERCGLYIRSYAKSRNLEFTVASVRSDVESLYEMSLCQGGNIVANSTFSWWGAWFAHQAGSPWATFPSSFGQGMPKTTDLYPEWGTVIPVSS